MFAFETGEGQFDMAGRGHGTFVLRYVSQLSRPEPAEKHHGRGWPVGNISSGRGNRRSAVSYHHHGDSSGSAAAAAFAGICTEIVGRVPHVRRLHGHLAGVRERPVDGLHEGVCWRLELGHRAGQICVESLRGDRLQFHFNLKFMYQENTTGTARRRIRRTLWYGPEMDAHPCNKRAVQSFSKLYLGPPPAPREASLEQEGSESQSAARGDQPDNEADESNVWDS